MSYKFFPKLDLVDKILSKKRKVIFLKELVGSIVNLISLILGVFTGLALIDLLVKNNFQQYATLLLVLFTTGGWFYALNNQLKSYIAKIIGGKKLDQELVIYLKQNQKQITEFLNLLIATQPSTVVYNDAKQLKENILAAIDFLETHPTNKVSKISYLEQEKRLENIYIHLRNLYLNDNLKKLKLMINMSEKEQQLNIQNLFKTHIELIEEPEEKEMEIGKTQEIKKLL